MEYKCTACNGLVWISENLKNYSKTIIIEKNQSNFWSYAFSFPRIENEFFISLGEGNTPCRSSKNLGEYLGINNLYFKDETHNPTNSFKDRAAALLISHARSWGYEKAVCASNGNQGASIAAYTSLEGMDCVNIIPEEIDVGKHAQMIAYNSFIRTSGKTVDETILEALDQQYDKHYQCTPEYNPLTLEGQKTIAFEIIKQVENLDWMIIPMGSGGLLVSIWKGFKELLENEIIENMPRLIGVQSQAMAPIVNEFNCLNKEDSTIQKAGKSQALGIYVRAPLYHNLAIRAIKESKGKAVAIPEIIMAQSQEDLAKNEGIFAEPASALTVSALRQLIHDNIIDKKDSVACLITGSGLKAPLVLEALSTRAKTASMGGILSTKLKILSQISLSKNKGIHGSKLQEIIGSVSLAAIYQHLKDLERKVLISRKREGKNVIYFLTEDGKKVLDALEILITLL